MTIEKCNYMPLSEANESGLRAALDRIRQNEFAERSQNEIVKELNFSWPTIKKYIQEWYNGDWGSYGHCTRPGLPRSWEHLDAFLRAVDSGATFEQARGVTDNGDTKRYNLLRSVRSLANDKIPPDRKEHVRRLRELWDKYENSASKRGQAS